LRLADNPVVAYTTLDEIFDAEIFVIEPGNIDKMVRENVVLSGRIY
jgi:hypothetical protein